MSLPTLLLKGNLEYTSNESQEYLDQQIPLNYIMEWFDKRIPSGHGLGSAKIKATGPEDKILILLSMTASGKSTLIAPRLYHLFQERTKKNIYCSQPRVLNAISIPVGGIIPYNTKEMLVKNGFPNFEPLIYGKNIGTQTGVFTKKPIKGIIFGTPGILVQQLNTMTNEQFMKKYSIILLDEVHERSLQVDTLMYILKKFIYDNYSNPECPFLVLMSATFDTKKYCDFMLSEVNKEKRYKNIIKVRGSTYPIQEIFLKYDSQNMIQSIIDTIIQIHKENEQDFIDPKKILKDKKIYKLNEDIEEDQLVKTQKFRDILIFLKSGGEIDKLKEKIEKLNNNDKYFQEYPVLPLALTSELVGSQSQEYKDAIERDISELKIGNKKPTRRVIFGTPVVETGVTIDTLKYVIDNGFSFSKEYIHNFSADTLVAKPITKGMYKQRRGRVGRKFPGICYPMYTKETFEKMQEDQYPDIIKDDITLDLLNILIREVDPENEINEKNISLLFKRNNDELTEFEKKINQKKINLYKLDLMDLPSADSLHYSMEKLYVLGAINRNSIPTAIGFMMNKFRFIKIESIKMILSAFAWKASVYDLITIASFLEFDKDDIFIKSLKENYINATKTGKFTLFYHEQKRIINYSKFKTDLFVADEMLSYVIIFNEFQRRISELKIQNLEVIKKTGDKKKLKSSENYNIVEILQEWGNKYGININGLIDVLEIRDSIINCLGLIGLNPFYQIEKSYYNISEYSDEEKFDYIVKMKQCIFEGYKQNIAIWNSLEKRYYTRKTHIPLNIQNEYLLSKFDINKYGDSNPRYIIYDKLLYKLNSKINIYEPIVSNISVLDGFINIDPNFDAII